MALVFPIFAQIILSKFIINEVHVVPLRLQSIFVLLINELFVSSNALINASFVVFFTYKGNVSDIYWLIKSPNDP